MRHDDLDLAMDDVMISSKALQTFGWMLLAILCMLDLNISTEQVRIRNRGSTAANEIWLPTAPQTPSF